MSDDEADPELVALLRSHLGLDAQPSHSAITSHTGVLADAEYIYNNAIDVSISMSGTQSAAADLYNQFTSRSYSSKSWNDHPLHPKLGDEGWDEVAMVRFIFTMDLLNFSFWSELPAEERWQVEWKGEKWTGYSGLVAGLRRGVEEGMDLTDARLWEEGGLERMVREAFRGCTGEEMSMVGERAEVLKEAAGVLRERFGDDDEANDVANAGDDAMPDSTTTHDDNTDGLHDGQDHRATDKVSVGSDADHATQGPSTETTAEPEVIGEAGRTAQQNEQSKAVDAIDGAEPMATSAQDAAEDETIGPDAAQRQARRMSRSILRLIEQADHSAGKLVNILAEYFPCFRDETRFEGRRVRFLKRAQIFVADLWAAFDGKGPGRFDDIEQLTMFADYRVPQMLYNLGVLQYSPPLSALIRRHDQIPSGHTWEAELRGCSIWAVELMRRHIIASHPSAAGNINAVLLDFLLYDLAKEVEATGTEGIPHHRTRSIWY